ncbi:hypothetical protein EMIT0P218_80210 [Pseudomonas sp. IT-P218]
MILPAARDAVRIKQVVNSPSLGALSVGGLPDWNNRESITNKKTAKSSHLNESMSNRCSVRNTSGAFHTRQ